MVTTSQDEAPTSISYQEFKNKIVAVATLSQNDTPFAQIMHNLRNVKYVTYGDGTHKKVRVAKAIEDANIQFRNYDWHSADNQSDVVEVARSLIDTHGWGEDDPDGENRAFDSDRENRAFDSDGEDYSDEEEDHYFPQPPELTRQPEIGPTGGRVSKRKLQKKKPKGKPKSKAKPKPKTKRKSTSKAKKGKYNSTMKKKMTRKGKKRV